MAADHVQRGPARLLLSRFPVKAPPGNNLWLHRAVYAASPGEVLVVDTGSGFEYGYRGEILAEAVIARGCHLDRLRAGESTSDIYALPRR